MGDTFQRLLEQLRQRREAVLPLSAEGTVCLRRFRQEEWLLLLGAGYIALPLCRIQRSAQLPAAGR